MAGNTANLIDNRDVTVALLSDPLGWRVRVVEEIHIDSATSCTRRRSLQAAPLRDYLGRLAPRRASHALLALNVAPMPRGPLLDFDVEGPDGSAWLLPRTEIAARQAQYLRELANLSHVQLTDEVTALLTAVLGFTGELLEDGEPTDFGAYLRDGLGRQVEDQFLSRWQDISLRCRTILRPRLDEFRGYSAPESPSLVLPQLFASGSILTDLAATELLDSYAIALERINAHAQQEKTADAADEFLNALADYANSYDLIVAMKVPLDEPFLVKYSERRDLTLTLRNRGHQDLVIADAQSNHVTFRVPDANVRITEFQADNPRSSSPAYGAFQSRTDAQSRAFYAHDPDRDYRIRLTFGLAPLRRLQVVPYLAALLLFALTVALWIDRPTSLGDLALIVGPSALAASVLLARDATTLGSRLRFWSTTCLVGAMIALLGTATILYVLGTQCP